tara:strand:+ start:2132 stop:2320 length:189 start_codon:yes stop_codon:yes gene_type:complete
MEEATTEILLVMAGCLLILFFWNIRLKCQKDKLKRELAEEINRNKTQRALDQGHCSNGLMFK